jgi:hypothetical protein
MEKYILNVYRKNSHHETHKRTNLLKKPESTRKAEEDYFAGPCIGRQDMKKSSEVD